MRNVLLFVGILNPFIWGNAQETLYANETHTMTLFFPSPIRQAVTGAEHFVFSYNRDNGQYFGLLQAHKGVDSNLLVVTRDGRAYAYGLSYSKQLVETHRIVKIAESIGLEPGAKVSAKPRERDSIPKIQMAVPIDPERERMAKGAEYLLNKKSRELRTKRKDGLVLRLMQLLHHGDKVYVEFEIRNNSAIDFEMDALEIFKINGRKGRRSSHQKLELRTLYKHKEPSIVRIGHRRGFVHVLPKFTFGDTERLMIELHEKNGNRTVRLFYR